MLRTAWGKLSLIVYSFVASLPSFAQNQALDLTGAGNEVNVTYNLNSGGFTVEQWVYFPTLSTGGSLINQTNGNLAAPLDIYVQGDGTINLWTGDGTTTTNQVSGAVITQATWHHVAVVYDPADVGNERKLYVDGNSTPVLTGASPALLNIGPVRIGRRDDDFEGDDAYFDEVRIWNIARTGPQISADYNTTIDPASAGLDVYLKFENSLQDLAPGNGDQSGTIAAGSIGYGPGAPLQNNALNFDGSDDIVNLGAATQFNIGTTFTFETWINLDSYPATANAVLFNKWQSGLEDKLLAITPSGNVSFLLFGSSVSLASTSTVPLGQWVHIAATYDGSTARIYINGNDDASTAATGDVSDGAGTMYLGGNGDGRSPAEFEYLDGSLDEVRFWNVPRTQDEIHASAYTAVPPSGALSAYYDFDLYVASGDNSGAVNLFDVGGNGLDGTLTGPFALNFSASNWVTSNAWDNDVFAPLFTSGFPFIDNISEVDFQINSDANEAGLLTVAVYADGTPTPSSNDVVAGTGAITFASALSATVTTTIGGSLTPGTPYDVYFVLDDFNSNRQPNPTLVEVTTATPPPPTITDATWQDLDGDGNIDHVQLLFDETITVNDPGTGSDGLDAVEIFDGASPVAIDNFDYTTVGVSSITINFSGSQIPGTGIGSLTLNYAQGGSSSIVSSSTVSEVADSDTPGSYIDGAPPVIISAVTTEFAVDGQIDGMDVELSEAIVDASSVYDGTTMTVSGSPATSTSTGTPDDNFVIVQFDPGGMNTGQTPNLTLHASKLSDGTSTIVGDQLFASTIDGAPPIVIDAFTSDTDINGNIDRIDITMSEDYDGGTLDAADFTVSGSIVASATPIATSTLFLTLTEIGGPNTDAEPTLTLGAGSLLDLSGNSIGSSQNSSIDDATPPAWISGFPFINNIASSSFDIDIQLSETGNTYYLILPDASPAPSVGDVIAGGVGEIDGGSVFVSTASTTETINITGLSPTTAYDVYLVSDDVTNGNQQASTTFFNVITTSAGPVQNTLAFDGVDDYVEIPDDPSLDISSDLTIETWVRFSSVVNEETVLVSKWNPDDTPEDRSYLLQINSSSDLGFIVSTDGTTGAEGVNFSAIQSNFSFTAGRWYHIAGTYSPSNALRIYVNGELIGENTTNIVSSIHESSASVVLGANGNLAEVGVGNVSTGVAMELDETRIWSLEKTQADIQSDMFNTLVGSISNLNASYTYDYTSGTTLLDDGSLGNDGTLNDNNDGVADGSTTGPIWGTSTVYDADVVAPFNVSGYPFVDNITESGFQITTQLSEIGVLSYVVVADGAPTPGKDDIRGGTGFLGAPAEASGTINVITPFTEFSGLASGLSASTNYDVYMVAEDLEGVPNVQNNVNFFDVTTNAPLIQNALDFDGTDDYISGTGVNLTSSDFTIEAWFNTNDVTAAQSIFSLGSGGTNNQSLHVNLEETQVLVGFFFDDVTIPYTVTTGWNHIAVTHDATTRESTVYINGQPIGSGTHSGNFTGNTDFTISRNAWDGFTGFFDGQLDEIRVWNSVRNQTEIAQNRYVELDPGLHADLVAYYQFNESTGTNVPDVKNAFNGTWNGSGGGAFTAPQWVASTALDIPPYIVTNTEDNGTGSLRDAITYANANPGTTISFLIDEPAPWEINLSSPLQQITAANTIIDGTTQPLWVFGDPNGMVQLNGSSLGAANGISVDASGVEIYGLIFTEFNGNALNGHVYLASNAADDAIIGASGKGNIFHNTDGNGIYIVDGDNATIQGNRFGTLDGVNVSGIGMGDHGIATTGEISGLLIGGDFYVGDGNLISGVGPSRYGLNLNGSGGGSGLTNVEIRGNLIGTNASATGSIPNQFGGINIQGNVLVINIGGPSPSDLNIISGNDSHGIRVQAGSAININGNYIGIQSDGSSALANNGAGIYINSAATGVNIGTINQNYIAENSNYGIFFDTNNSLNTTIGNNIIQCNSSGGIGFGASPATSTPTILSMSLGGATVQTPGAANGSTVTIWVSDDGCSNNQSSAFYASETVSGGQADFISAFAPGAHYTATVYDPATGISEFSAPFFFATVYPSAEGAGEALSFSGSDYVDLGNAPEFATSNIATLEAWVKFDNLSGTQEILSKSALAQGTEMLISGGNLIMLLMNGPNSVTVSYPTSNLTTDTWYHIAGVIDHGDYTNSTLYVNGIQVGSATPAGDLNGSGIADGSFTLKIGNWDALDRPFLGDIDEVRIWNTSLAEDGIRQYIAQKVTNMHPEYSSLIAYYRMDDSGDATLSDVLGGNDGSIIGATHVPSGAHLGDESFSEYLYTAGSGRSFYDFDVMNLGTANLPLHIYRVNQTPTNNSASGFNAIDDTEYYGVFAPGQTFDVRLQYSGVETNRRLLSRQNGSAPAWLDVSGFFGTDLGDQEINATSQLDEGQYVTALEISPYPTEQGAGYAMSFSGSDYVTIPDIDLSAVDQITLEAWISPTSLSGAYSTIVRQERSGLFADWYLSVDASNIRFQVRAGSVLEHSVSYTLPLDQWSHVAGVYDGTQLQIYVNGIVIGSPAALSGNIAYNSTPVHSIGGYSNDGGSSFNEYFDGQIDEVRIWNTALVEEDIRQYMIEKLDAGHPAFGNLVAAYKFDENNASTAIDIAGGNDGTITGALPVVSGAPQGNGSLFSYDPGPIKFDTSPDDDVVVEIDDASNGFHIYYVGGTPDQDQADGFNTITDTKYYGVFAPGQTVDVRMDYNNGGSQDPDKRILYRENRADNAASGGWERLSGLLNNDPTTDSLYAYNVPSGEIVIADLATPSTYPLLSDFDPGDALDFVNGTNGYVDIGKPILSTTDGAQTYTIEFWMNSSQTGSNGVIFSQYFNSGGGEPNRFNVVLNGTSGLVEVYKDTDELVTSTVTLNDGVWHHVAIVKTVSGIYELYVDGSLDETGSFSDTNPFSDAPVVLGAQIFSGSPEAFYVGLLDEVRIWKAALTGLDLSLYANTTNIYPHPNYADMLAYYRFDDGTGVPTLQDIFSNNDGSLEVINPLADWVPSGALAGAPEQNALNFDGASDFVSFARQNLSTGLTYEAWINTSSTANTSAYEGNPALAVIGDNDNSVEGAFGIHDGKVRYTHWQGTATDFDQIDGTVNVNDGSWHHIAVTHESGSNEVRIYVDGILDVVDYSLIYSSGISANRIGSSYLDGTGNDNFFQGEIDEVRIWDIVLTEDEIRDNIYNQSFTGHGSYGNLLVHYGFNQGAAGVDNTGIISLNDLSSYGNGGTLNTFTLNGSTSNWVSSGIFAHSPSTPTTQASSLTPFGVTESSVNVTWTNGNGQRRIVVVHDGTGNPFPAPSDFVFGRADDYGFGDDIDNGWYVVYNGYNNAASIAGLSPDTDYEVAVLEVNGPPSYEAYNSNTAPDNPVSFTTDAPVDPRAIYFTEASATDIYAIPLAGGIESSIASSNSGFGDYGIDYHEGLNRIYYVDGSSTGDRIMTALPDGSNLVEFVDLATSGAVYRGLAVDSLNNILYLVAPAGLTTYNMNDGTLIDTHNVFSLTAYDVEVFENHVYWSESGGGGAIYRADIGDISATVTSVMSSAASPGNFVQGIAIEPNERKIYWTNDNGEIRKADLDGANDEIVISGLSTSLEDIEIDYETNRLIYVDNPSNSTIVAAEYDGTFIENLLVFSGSINYMHVYTKNPGSGGGPSDYALDFDGVNDHLVAADISELGITNGTIEAWIHPNSLALDGASLQRVLAKPSGASNADSPYQLFITDTGGFGLTLGNGGASVSFNSNNGLVQTSTWQHIAVSWDGSNVRFYYNGVEDLVVPQGAMTPNTNASSLIIGGFNGTSGSGQFNGAIDEVRIWNIARSEPEINDNRDFFLGGSESGLVAYYPMSDGTGSLEVTDVSPYGNNASLTNMDENTDWISGPGIVFGGGGFNFYEDFGGENLPTISSSGPILLSTGTWDSEGVLESGDIDARGGDGNAIQVEAAGGNYIQTPFLQNVNEFSFWYKGNGAGGTFEVQTSIDGGSTFSVSHAPDINPTPTYEEYTLSLSNYNGPIRIAYISGTTPLFVDDVGTDGDAVPINVDYSTLTVPGGNLATGSTDNLIYAFSITPSEQVQTIGFILTLDDANYDPTDFPSDPFKVWINTSNDFGTATQLGTYDFAGTIPDGPTVAANQVAILFEEILPAGFPAYIYTSVDVAAGATTSNSFTVLGIDPENDIGFEQEISYSGTLDAGSEFTISSGDVTAPNVVSVTSDLSIVKDGDSGLSVVVIFDEAMTDDGSQDPVITFPIEDPSATLTDIGGVWNDAFEYEAFFSVTDANETIADVDVRVSGAQDFAGNTMADYDEADVFSIDTENPTVVSITRASADPTNGPSVDFEVTFSESVNDIDSDDFGVVTVTGDATGTISLFTGASGSTATVSVFGLTGNGTIRLDYLNTNLDGVVDDNGNPSETDYLSGEVYTVDNIAPAVAIDSKSTSITSPEITGTVDDPTAVIEVTILGNTFSATNNGDFTWTLPQGTISPALGNGTYNVQVDATDQAGNVGSDATVDELVVQLGVTGLMSSVVNSTSITMVWDAGLDADFYELDVSTSADFSTFLTGYNSKVIATETETVTGLDYSDDYYFRIRLVNTQGETSSNSTTVAVRTTRDATTAADSVALRQIYDAIGGSSWTPAVNWTSAYMRDWNGITMGPARTRVRRVDFPGVGASGSMPNPFTGGAVGGLSDLRRMNASNNDITGLIDFSATPLVNNVNVSGNALEFDDLEPLIGITTLNYANQSSVQFNQTVDANPIEVRYNNDYSLNIGPGGLGIGGSSNTYTWYRNDAVIVTTTDVYTVAGSEAVIRAIGYDNMGEFRAEVTSSLVPGLTINVDPQIVWAIADMQVSVTDADGDPLSAPFNAYMLETTPIATGFPVLETLENQVSSTFIFPDVVLGDYITFVESDLELYIPTYFGDVFEWSEADTLFFRSDDVISMTMTEVPPELKEGDGDGTLDVLIEEDFGDDGGRVDARRRAAKRKCGLRRKRSGGRTGQDGDEYELVAYGETDDNGEFKFGFLPEGTYRFFVEYPGIPLDESSFVEFEVGEAGISDTDFKLEAFATPDGIEVTIEAVLGIILEYFKDLQIYPNPSSEYLNIRYRHLKSNDVTAQLVDLSGNTLWSTDLRNGFDGELRIDVSDYEDGIYILRFYDREDPNGNVVSFRVIVRD